MRRTQPYTHARTNTHAHVTPHVASRNEGFGYQDPENEEDYADEKAACASRLWYLERTWMVSGSVAGLFRGTAAARDIAMSVQSGTDRKEWCMHIRRKICHAQRLGRRDVACR